MTFYSFLFFFFNDTATTEIYTLSLHDALPIWICPRGHAARPGRELSGTADAAARADSDRESERYRQDRKSTRLNSSHANISYAVFCLKKKNIKLIRGVSIAGAKGE